MTPLRCSMAVLCAGALISLAPGAEPKGPTDAEVQAAVADGLRWLVRQQKDDGRWTFQNSNDGHDCAATGFALLVLMRTGELPAGHPLSRNLDAGLKFLLKKQQAHGQLGTPMQAHAVATLALCEAYARTGDLLLQRAAQRAVDAIVRAQHPGGGWRYSPGEPGDLESTGWQVMALRTGQAAGLSVPEQTWKHVDAFLDSVASPDGSYCYLPNSTNTSPSMTAVGLMCRQCRGWKADDPRLARGANILRQLPATADRSRGIFYIYFATLFMSQHPADAENWNLQLRKYLLEQQEKEKPARAGSWFCKTWGQFGPTFATSLALLMLTEPDLGARPAPRPARELNEAMVEALWAELSGEDVFRAHQVGHQLAASPESAVVFLGKQLRPVTVDPDRIARLVADLEAPRFPLRQRAEQELEALGELAEPSLREALARKPGLDLRTRLERLLGRMVAGPPEPETVRTVRAIRVLENAGTPAARELLGKLAKGAAGSSITRAAAAALQRLGN